MIKEFIIGLLVFVTISVVLFGLAGDFSESYGETISETQYDYGTARTRSFVADLESKAPGGTSSSQGTGGDVETDTDLGFKTGAKIIGQGLPIFHDIIEGDNATGREGLMTKLGIKSNFTVLLYASIIVIVTLILISSLLRNVIK